MTELTQTNKDEPAEAGRSLWQAAWGRFRRNVLAVVGLAALVVLVGVCYGSLPYWMGTHGQDAHATTQGRDALATVPRYAWQDLGHVMEGPSGDHRMGTDKLGRDLLGRFLVGGALSLAIGLASAAIAVGIGTTVGLLAGYVGGRTDAVLMRLVDVLYGLPYILLVILMRVVLVGPMTAALAKLHLAEPGQWANVTVLLVGIGSVSWLTMARVVRGQTMSLRDQGFVEAARAMGVGNAGILLRHILPNLVGPILVYATLTVPQAILSESFLSFLGLGIQPPLPSWGNLASDGIEALSPVRVYWWLVVWPCAGLSAALLSLNFVGDGLRDALDPKGR